MYKQPPLCLMHRAGEFISKDDFSESTRVLSLILAIHLIFFLLLFFSFLNRALLCNPSELGTHRVAQAGLELTPRHAYSSASWVLGLWVGITVTNTDT